MGHHHGSTKRKEAVPTRSERKKHQSRHQKRKDGGSAKNADLTSATPGGSSVSTTQKKSHIKTKKAHAAKPCHHQNEDFVFRRGARDFIFSKGGVSGSDHTRDPAFHSFNHCGDGALMDNQRPGSVEESLLGDAARVGGKVGARGTRHTDAEIAKVKEEIAQMRTKLAATKHDMMVEEGSNDLDKSAAVESRSSAFGFTILITTLS